MLDDIQESGQVCAPIDDITAVTITIYCDVILPLLSNSSISLFPVWFFTMRFYKFSWAASC